MRPNRYAPIEVVAPYIHSTVGSVRVMCSKRRIPYIKCGRRVLFDLDEIDAWLDNQRVAVTK